MKTLPERLNAIGAALAVILAFALPLTMDLSLHDAFDLPKLALAGAGAVALAALWLARAAAGRPAWIGSGLDVPLLALLAVMGVSTCQSIAPTTSLFGQYRIYAFGLLPTFCFAALFWTSRQFFDRAGVLWLARAAALSGLLAAVYAVLQYGGHEVFSRMPAAAGGRVWSTLGNPVYLGGFLAMNLGLALSAWTFQWTSSRRDDALWLLSIAAMLCALALTLSRGAWVAFAAAVGLLVFFRRAGASPKRLKAVLLGCALLLALVAATRPAVRERLVSLADRGENSNAARIAGWTGALRIAIEHPWLGTGPDTFKDAFRAHRSAAYIRATGAAVTQGHAHNDFLQYAASTGMAGLGAYLWLLLAALNTMRRRLDRKDDATPLAAGLFCALAALFVQNIFNFSSVATSALAALYAGAFSALSSPAPAQPLSPVRPRWWGLVPAAALLVALPAIFGPVRADAIYQAGRQAAAAGDTRRALKGFDAAVARNPRVGEYRLALANACRDHAAALPTPAERLPFLHRAVEETGRIVRLEPRNPDAHINSGVALMWLTQMGGEDRSREALAAFRQSVEMDPLSAEGWGHLARMHHFFGDVDQEKLCWSKVLEIDPGNTTARRLSEQLNSKEATQ